MGKGLRTLALATAILASSITSTEKASAQAEKEKKALAVQVKKIMSPQDEVFYKTKVAQLIQNKELADTAKELLISIFKPLENIEKKYKEKNVNDSTKDVAEISALMSKLVQNEPLLINVLGQKQYIILRARLTAVVKELLARKREN